MVLEPGTAVPEVVAENQRGERVRPDFSRPTVVYFYPKDDTSGCKTEARQFEDRSDDYEEAGVTVYGVSTDDVDSHRDFAEAHDLGFDLLADPDGTVAEAFDVELRDGRTPRTTFVVAQNQVVGVYEGVRPDGHATDVLRDLDEAGLVDAAEQ
ncbi:peroxiredoxin [Haloarcula nitratireducens]|uniref:thioredoxin-dependent peroxiredoxin n=1 Tax=Haloarcula nitratireducens TaxID=2487749 RepID=A0AAW4PCY4_9EURY|nr:peroxiredoxin [Halomicroarcula nitratireducens]MBX0296091.1 peroxiredoxin [Halomicroarcula nitratireducens]